MQAGVDPQLLDTARQVSSLDESTAYAAKTSILRWPKQQYLCDLVYDFALFVSDSTSLVHVEPADLQTTTDTVRV